MSKLRSLKEAKDLASLAKLLGFTAKGLSYTLYKLDSTAKYRTFTIPKKSGGTRTIQAPTAQLRLLQQRLGELLDDCADEVRREHPRFWNASHGFRRKRTILSNSNVHRRKLYVFNVDLEDFFGTINFGRVRGFFLRDRAFELEAPVATVIAQIACHENALPQGSPCSPVISNLIGNILDLRMLAMARNGRCTYTRYADDLTFSTNEQHFPRQVAVNVRGATWTIGRKLRQEIEGAGFKINDGKTRMSLRTSRQTVTGLVVNAKPNINQHYYRFSRSMCNSLFQTGQYFRPGDPGEILDNLNPLEGTLSFINFVKERRDRPAKANKLAIKAGEFDVPEAPRELYRKFLFYKHFVRLTAPLIVTEGISDITYLHCAIRSLAAAFPNLAGEKNGKFVRLVKFLKPSGISRDILKLGNGSGGQGQLIAQYPNNLKSYKYKPMDHPVIILCDNDEGAKPVFSHANKRIGVAVSLTMTEPFYYLGDNLYLVKVPEGAPPVEAPIERLFDPAVLAELVDGKPFDIKKEHGDATAYGKVVFAEKVVRAKAGMINFSGFSDLLSRIDQCIVHYATVKAARAAAAVAVAPVAGGVGAAT